MFMNKTQMKKAYNLGHLDDVVKQLRTYGTIAKDKSWDENKGYYAGSHRVMHIVHHNLEWEVHMHNGEVTRLGYTL